MTPEQLELVRTYNRKLNVEAMRKRVINSAVMLGFYQRGINSDSPLQDAAEALLRMNDNDIENARRYKSKKSRLLNEDELAGTIEYDAAAHQYDIICTDTGDIYSQNTLSDWTCQGG